MAGDKAVVAKAEEVERGILLEAKVQARSDSSLGAESVTSSSAFETPRPSSVTTPKVGGKGNPREWPTPKPRKYVSPMAQAREEKKRREAGSTARSKDWPSISDMETSSTPTSGSEHSDASTAKPGTNVPKFGEWEEHSANSGPCYTLLFQNAAQEKKDGGLVRVTRPDSPPRTEDLYNACPPEKKKKKKKKNSPLCCFTA